MGIPFCGYSNNCSSHTINYQFTILHFYPNDLSRQLWLIQNFNLSLLHTYVQAMRLIDGTKVDYDPTAHEDEPKALPVGISIQNLTKIYDEVNIITVYIHIILYIYIIMYLINV